MSPSCRIILTLLLNHTCKTLIKIIEVMFDTSGKALTASLQLCSAAFMAPHNVTMLGQAMRPATGLIICNCSC